MSVETMALLRECIPSFFILSDENRHKILDLLLNQGKLNVNALTEQLHLSRPAVSHHLKLMLDAKMVGVEQIGKERYYFATLDHAIRTHEAMLVSLRENCGYKLEQ